MEKSRREQCVSFRFVIAPNVIIDHQQSWDKGAFKMILNIFRDIVIPPNKHKLFRPIYNTHLKVT